MTDTLPLNDGLFFYCDACHLRVLLLVKPNETDLDIRWSVGFHGVVSCRCKRQAKRWFAGPNVYPRLITTPSKRKTGPVRLYLGILVTPAALAMDLAEALAHDVPHVREYALTHLPPAG